MPSFLPEVRHLIKSLAAIAAAVFVPVALLVAVQYQRDAAMHVQEQENVRTLSAAQEAMLAIDELTAVPPAGAAASADGSAWSARERSLQERIANHVGHVLSSGAVSLPEDSRVILDRVRLLEAGLATAGGPPGSSGPTRLLAETLRGSLDQLRLLQQVDFETDQERFERTTHRIFLFAIPALLALAIAGGVLAANLFRAVRQQWRLEEEIRESLVRSEERYRSLFDGSLDAIFSLGADGRFVSANPAAERLTGRTLAELKAIHFLELCAPDQREAAAEAFRAAFCRKCLTLDTAMIGAGGARHELFISGAPTLLRGEIVGVACIARDVTERRKVEEVQNQERQRLRQILDSQFGFVVVLTLEGAILEINQAPLTVLQKPRAEVLGQRLWEVTAMEPGTRLQVEGAIRRAAHGEVVRGDVAAGFPAVGPREFDLVCSPLRDPAGKVVNVIGFAVDVTERKQAEMAQRESEMQLRTILDSEPECVKLLDADGALIDMNPAGLRMLGAQSLDQVRGARAVEMVDTQYRQMFTEGVAAVFRGETTKQVFEIVALDGSRHWIDQHAVPMWDPNEPGKVRQMLAVVRDVTEQKRADEKLREQDELLRKVSDQVPGVIYQFQLFPDGRSCFPYASEGIRTIYEVAPESVTESAEAVFRVLHPDDFNAVVASIQRSAETMEPWQCEFRAQLPTRGVRWLEGHSVPERLPDRSVLWHGYIRDITARKEAEADLQRLAAIVGASQDFIGYASLEGRLLYVNPAGRALVGLNPSAPAGDLHVPDFVLEADHDFLAGELMTQLLQNGSWRGEFRLRHFAGGEPIPVDLNSFMIRDAAGEPIAIANISRDIRERLKAERLANRSQRLEAIGTLAGGIAHDMNNALAPVLMATQVLQLRYPGEDELVDIVQTSCERAADMVRQLLTFANGASGERILIQPWQLIRELEKIVTGTFPKNIELRIHCASDVGMVLGNPTQLHQVLLNLCVNARDAMARGGTLTMTVEAKNVDTTFASTALDATPGRYICLTVEDTGTGIPPEVLDRIFEPFFTTKEPDKGTGLGLSTVLGIVKGHGGFLQVYSDLGKGSLFQIYLPVAQDGADRAELAAQRPAAFRGNGEMILIVDDETAILSVARFILERMNFTVITAENGAEGIIRATENQDAIRVVITDLHMPLMDGLAFARALRPICPNTKIVVSSGRLEESTHAEFRALGISGVLHKPFNEEQLAEVLRAVLQVNYEL
ncbi:MAG: PAS domain S-box protein [Chthoniobacter sp.]|nr:PAS domain S-box protein [Chthoniobacter sp.]